MASLRVSISPHNGRSSLLIPLNPTPNPLNRLPNTRPRQRTHRQNSTIPNTPSLLAFKNPLYKPFLNPYNLHTILPILLICQNQQWHSLRLTMLQHILQHQPTLLQPPLPVTIPGPNVSIPISI